MRLRSPVVEPIPEIEFWFELTLVVEFYTGIYAIGRLGTSSNTYSNKGNISIRLLGGSFNVSGAGAYNAVLDACQDAGHTFDGSYYVEISENATIGYKSIGASGITGTATLNAPAALAKIANGFDKITTYPYPLGDVNADGNITNTDVTLLVRVLSGWSVNCSHENADLDSNGILTNKDAIILIQKLAGWY